MFLRDPRSVSQNCPQLPAVSCMDFDPPLLGCFFVSCSVVDLLAILGPSWATEAPSWGQVGPILAPRWGHVGVKLWPCRLNLRSYGLLLASWPRKPKCPKSAVLSSILGGFEWSKLGLCWAMLALCWAKLGHLGGVCSHLKLHVG